MKENRLHIGWNRDIDTEKAEILCGENFPVLKEIAELALTKRDTQPDQSDYMGTLYADEVASPTHLLMEGDNLISLACLCYTHKGKIDVIYIDPPYNTGNKDFMYNDSWVDSDHKDRKSLWMSFIEKRLRQAKILLTENGVIFISIDDNMLYELKLLCDEIFGSQNFVETFCWTKTYTPASLSNKTRNNIEYILCYEKNKSDSKYFGKTSINSDAPLLNRANNVGMLEFPVGSVRFNIEDGVYESSVCKSGIEIINNFEIRDGTNITSLKLRGRFKWSQKYLDNELWNGTYFIVKSKAFAIRYQKDYSRVQDMLPNKLIDASFDVGTTDEAHNELKSIFDGKVRFDYPKPLSLIKFLINMVTVTSRNKNAIVLDFFAGSGTTGHAVLELNKEDGGSRQFILCTNNENNIMTDVCYPRIKRVMCGYKKPNSEKVEGLGGSLKYFKTDFVEWHDNMHELAYKVGATCSGVLRTKEGVYNELENNEHYELYYQDDDSLLAIYKDDYSVFPDAEELEDLRVIMNDLNCANKILYIFSVSDENDDYLKEEFKNWENIEVKLMPIEMIKEYKNLFNTGVLKKDEV